MVDRLILARATSSDTSPTPGYLYGEIAKMIYSSNEGCTQVVTYLLKRLRKPSGVVKLKVLNIVKQVCPKAENGFKRAIRHHIGDVKDCLSFTGPPDPLRGDEIYVLVRSAAKEAIEAVYSNESIGMTGKAPAFEDRIRGFGSVNIEDDNPNHRYSSTPYVGEGYTTSNTTSSASAMVGIGNCDPGQVRRSSWLKYASDSIKSTASAAVSAAEEKVKNFRLSRGDTTQRGDMYIGGRDSFGNATAIRGCVSNRGPAPYWVTNGKGGSNGPSDMNFHPPVVCSGVGVQLVASPYNNQQRQQPEDSIGKEESVVACSSNMNSSHDYQVSPISFRADDCDEYLDNAIAVVCAPGGTRAVPSKDKFDAFMVKIALLDHSKVQGALLELAATADNDWRVQSKALSVLAHLIFDGETKLLDSDTRRSRNNEIRSSLLRICEQGHLRAAAKEKCTELLCLLERNIQHESGKDSGTADGAPASSMTSEPTLLIQTGLLGDDDDSGGGEIIMSSTAATLPTALRDSSEPGEGPENYVNLFDNMTVNKPPQPSSSTTNVSSFPFMSQNAAVMKDDTFQGRTTIMTIPSSTPNDKSLDVGDGVPTTATGSEDLVVDLISGRPISTSSSSSSSSKNVGNSWDGLDPFHVGSQGSSFISTEIPIQAQVEINTNVGLEMKYQIGNSETGTAQPSSVASNVGMQHMPLVHGNDGAMGPMPALSVYRQRQMFRIIQHQQAAQYQSNNMANSKEMAKYKGRRSFNGGRMSSSQKFTPIELEHDEFSFVKDAMKLEGRS